MVIVILRKHKKRYWNTEAMKTVHLKAQRLFMYAFLLMCLYLAYLHCLKGSEKTESLPSVNYVQHGEMQMEKSELHEGILPSKSKEYVNRQETQKVTPLVNVHHENQRFKPDMLDVLSPFDMKQHPPYLSNFRNPCWLEDDLLHCFPYFLLIGMPRCATTDLFMKLAAHPDVISPAGRQTEDMDHLEAKTVSQQQWNYVFSKYKEPNYWSKLFRGGRNITDYAKFFDEAAKDIDSGSKDGFHGAVTFEASSSTFWDNSYWQESPDNKHLHEPKYLNQHYIKQLLPDIRLLLSLRNPADQFFVGYKHRFDNGYSDENSTLLDFDAYARTNIKAWEKCLIEKGFRMCLYSDSYELPIKQGMYAHFLSDWFDVFPPEQIAILLFEEYIKDTSAKLKGIFRFLGLEDRPLQYNDMVHSLSTANRTEVQESNQSTSREMRKDTYKPYDERLVKESMQSKTREMLEEFYKPYNEQLAELLKDDRFLWK